MATSDRKIGGLDAITRIQDRFGITHIPLRSVSLHAPCEGVVVLTIEHIVRVDEFGDVLDAFTTAPPASKTEG